MTEFSTLVERQTKQPESDDGSPMAWINVTRHDGRTGRWGPFRRWVAELVIGALGFDPGDIHTAVIEPEPAWVTDLAK